MSYKLSIILSFPFLMQVMLFLGDLSIVECIHSQLDSLAQTISFQISQKGSITDQIKEYVKDTANANIYCVGGCEGYLGDIITFTISKPYKPIIISPDEMFISITRTTVIGYFA